MSDVRKIFIAGSGGIGRATALFLLTMFDEPTEVCLGDRDEDQLADAEDWIRSIRPDAADRVSKATMPERLADALGDERSDLRTRLDAYHLVVDCLPGSLAFQLAQLAERTSCDYVNVTEFVEETEKIRRTFADSGQRFLLQTGLAPGFIDLLGVHLVDRLRSTGRVERVESLRLRVGALSQLAEPPSHYAFTWSTQGVATEYVEPAVALRGGRKVRLPSLTESETVVLNGLTLEARLTSGGTADLCDAFEGTIDQLDYKTLRLPGHYAWIDRQIEELGDRLDAQTLEDRMKEAVPYEREDLVVLYAAAEGRGENGILQRESVSRIIPPIRIDPETTLLAIQLTTAATLAQSADYLLRSRLDGGRSGILQQSDLPADHFLRSPLLQLAYQPENHGEFRRRLTAARG